MVIDNVSTITVQVIKLVYVHYAINVDFISYLSTKALGNGCHRQASQSAGVHAKLGGNRYAFNLTIYNTTLLLYFH